LDASPALYVFLGLVAGYALFIYWILRTGKLEKWNLSLMGGIILMIRTQRGKPTIDFIARPRRFWNLVGDLGIVFTLVGMVAMTFFFLFSVWIALQPGSGVPALGPTEIFVIPGVTPFVPLWYGLIALIITLVVHEGGHGVLARANGLKLKSIGLLMLIVPIGAFVEPDDLDLKVASRRQRLRVFGAGPAVNFTFAALSLSAFALLMGTLAPVPGVHVARVTEGGPAETAGIVPGDVIVTADTVHLDRWQDLVVFLNHTTRHQTVTFGMASGALYHATLETVWEALPAENKDDVRVANENGVAICRRWLGPSAPLGGACSEELDNHSYMGVAPLLPEDTAFLAHPLGDHGKNLLYMFSLPLAEVRGEQPVLTVYMPAFTEAPFSPAVFWVLANLLFWIFWINLAVGVTNILPMVPLDGGHIFRDAVGGVVQKVKPRMPQERRDRIVSWAAGTMSIVILVAFILEIVGPHIVQGL
jgi:membrane-associated protease RseP (regulator of RpoE activity)